MSNKITLLALFLFCFGFVQGQVKIEGVVKDSTGQGLEMANVIALSAADTSMISYAFTDEDGRFRITVEDQGDYFLRISYLGYKQQEIPLSAGDSQEKIFKTISLKPESMELMGAEVVENIPIVVSGDTISYKADAFTTGRERKLEDVLGQLPGFEVDENGEVKVQGKKVDKVMVEGKDFFDGDTKLATKNIPANAVDKVQVLRNYNEITPMQGLDNDDRIALNIKLKDGKKNIVFGDIKAEGGLDERYLVHPNIFWYTPKVSLNFIGDINNVGEPAFTFDDYMRFGGGFRNLTSRGGTSFQMGGGDLGFALNQSNRAQEITSRFGAANFSLNPSKKWSFDGFFIGNYSKTLSGSLTNRQYLTPDTLSQIIDLNETLTTGGVQENTSGLFKVSATYTPSSKLHIGYKAFGKITETENFNDRLSDFEFLPADSITTGTTQRPYELRQNLEAYYDVNDKNLVSLEVQYLLDFQNPTFDMRTTRPSFLTSIPLQDSSRLIQFKEVSTNKLDATLNHYLIFNNTNHIQFTLGGSYTDQSFTSSISETLEDGQMVDLEGDSLNNNVNFSLADLFAGVHYRLKLGKFEINPGVSYHNYELKDQQLGQTNTTNVGFVLPDLLVRYNFKKTVRLQLDYKMQAEFTDINNLTNGLIISSYNSLFQGNTGIQNALAHNFSLTYFNINLFNFTNIFAGANYILKADDITQVTRLNGLDRVNSPINTDGLNEILTGFAGIEKRWGKYKAQVGGTVNLSKINNFINDQQNLSETFTQAYRSSVSTNYKKAPNVEIGYNLVINKYEGVGVSNTFLTHSPTIKFDAIFLKNFTFEADYSYNFYKSPAGLGSTEFDFLNARLMYRPGEKSPWEFSIRGLNLLSTGSIRQDDFSDFFVSTTRTDVLPRYVLLGVRYDL